MTTKTEKVILVYVELNSASYSAAEDAKEFTQLATSAGAEIGAFVKAKRKAPDSKFFVGEGKVGEIKEQVQANAAQLVIFNHPLSPSQERNLERALECRVLDRTGLILDIFAQRARTFEGKLQVELAQIDYSAARLKRCWTHLERQRGGIGLRGGMGETQLEVDKRILQQRVSSIKKRLEKVRSQRKQSQRARKRAHVPILAFIGYTNAGKSTLFNRLTRSAVYVADKLFATLDPTLRRLNLPGFGKVIVADTVGFVRHLPHELVEAFRATLEETKEADLLLHIVDASDPEHQNKIIAVNEVLQQIGAQDVPQLLIYNKIDLIPELEGEEGGKIAGIDYDLLNEQDESVSQIPTRVWVSAVSGEGVDLLVQAIKERLTKTSAD